MPAVAQGRHCSHGAAGQAAAAGGRMNMLQPRLGAHIRHPAAFSHSPIALPTHSAHQQGRTRGETCPPRCCPPSRAAALPCSAKVRRTRAFVAAAAALPPQGAPLRCRRAAAATAAIHSRLCCTCCSAGWKREEREVPSAGVKQSVTAAADGWNIKVSTACLSLSECVLPLSQLLPLQVGCPPSPSASCNVLELRCPRCLCCRPSSDSRAASCAGPPCVNQPQWSSSPRQRRRRQPTMHQPPACSMR